MKRQKWLMKSISSFIVLNVWIIPKGSQLNIEEKKNESIYDLHSNDYLLPIH